MRFFSLITALFVAFVAAQSQGSYAINTPQGGFQVTAGQSITITWAPAPGSINIYLTQGAVNTPGQGTLLAQSIDGSTGTATFTIPSSVQASSNGQYNFGIANAGTNNFVNFSAGFAVSGASTASATASATASLSSLSASGSSRMSSASASASSALSSASSAMSSRMSSASASASSISASLSSAISSASRSASSSAAAATTSAPSSNGAGMVQAGGMFAMVAGFVAVF